MCFGPEIGLSGSGFGVGSCDWLRLWRAFFSQPDREDDDGKNRQKLTLPILKGFKPELGSFQVLPYGERALAMLSGLHVVCPRSPESVPSERQREKSRERDG